MDRLLSSKKDILKQHRYLSPELQAEVAIRIYEQKSNDTSKQIQSNLSEQNGSLSERINIRRQSGRSRTYSPAYVPNHINLRNIQQKVEEIIEKLLIEKHSKIKQIKKKFKSRMHRFVNF